MGAGALRVTAWKFDAEGWRPTDEIDRFVIPLPSRKVEEASPSRLQASTKQYAVVESRTRLIRVIHSEDTFRF